jgi:hypothetical protein
LTISYLIAAKVSKLENVGVGMHMQTVGLPKLTQELSVRSPAATIVEFDSSKVRFVSGFTSIARS